VRLQEAGARDSVRRLALRNLNDGGGALADIGFLGSIAHLPQFDHLLLGQSK